MLRQFQAKFLTPAMPALIDRIHNELFLLRSGMLTVGKMLFQKLQKKKRKKNILVQNFKLLYVSTIYKTKIMNKKNE